MAVLLHVQGSGRDPLRPFGGHAIRTVAWERFDPGSVGRDVDTIVISAPDPLTGVDAVAAIRDAGDTHPVLLVPDESPGWRQVAASRLPNADVVLGGIRSLPDYLPSADYPLESGQWPDLEGSEDTREAARVIDLRLRIPRGGSHRMLRERMGDQPHDIASAVRQFTADLTGDQREEPTRGDVTPAVAGADVEESPFEWPVITGRRPAAKAPAARAEPPAPIARTEPPEPIARTEPSEPSPGRDGRADGGAAPRADDIRRSEPVVSRTLMHAVADVASDPDVADAPPLRRAARSLSDPAVLVPALLGCTERLDGPHDVATALADLVQTTLPADAVDVLLPEAGSWRTVTTAGSATGAGRVADVVDTGGLVTWLESFDTPVVLDGSDLAAPGSWVLAALVRGDGAAMAVVLCWREPGHPVFDPAALTTLAGIGDDARPALRLALQVRELARALVTFAD